MTVAYRYRAATPEGQLVEGSLEATSSATALDELRRQRLVPVDLVPATPTRPGAGQRRLRKPAALALFTRTVATMLAAGVPLERALGFASDQARHPEVADAARTALGELRGGASLSAALARRPREFGSVYVAMVAAGEESGQLDDALRRLADHLEEGVELRAHVRSALVYPALMTFATGTGIIVLLLFVVPRFTALLLDEGGTLPLSTRILVGASAALSRGGWLLLLLGAAAVLFTRAWLAEPANRRRWHAWRLTTPLAGDLEIRYATATFARALAMLLAGGRALLPALRTARATAANAEVAAALGRATEAVSHGERLNVALRGALPPLATELIAVGEETGRLDEMCDRVADAYDAEVRRSLRTLVAVIEPALILFFGLVVGFVALAMLQAIYGLNRSPF